MPRINKVKTEAERARVRGIQKQYKLERQRVLDDQIALRKALGIPIETSTPPEDSK